MLFIRLRRDHPVYPSVRVCVRARARARTSYTRSGHVRGGGTAPFGKLTALETGTRGFFTLSSTYDRPFYAGSRDGNDRVRPSPSIPRLFHPHFSPLTTRNFPPTPPRRASLSSLLSVLRGVRAMDGFTRALRRSVSRRVSTVRNFAAHCRARSRGYRFDASGEARVAARWTERSLFHSFHSFAIDGKGARARDTRDTRMNLEDKTGEREGIIS